MNVLKTIFVHFQVHIGTAESPEATLITEESMTDGWFVEWIRMNIGNSVFHCVVNGWLDNGADASGPGSRTVNCKKDEGNI